ncbi:MAG: hypothetical protein CR975_03270 [Gammaproteobacteria bacterium]|nr:MAG: hypothetical protein CR975_03270 [Gammaproteobacteria bacterium]
MFKKLFPVLLAVSMTCAADQAMIVLDGSGSMQGGDCNDIEVLIPLSKIDKNAVLEKVKAITPKGKTPISDSLQQAAKKLHFTEDKATVILISDGKETCDADPCATAKELEKQGIDFTAHVIGFNVDTNTDKQLACIANATGGEYFSAKNADDLNSAMKKAVKKVMEKTTTKVTGEEHGELELFATKNGQRVEAVFKIKQNNEDGNKTVGSCYPKNLAGKKCVHQLPVGTYEVRATYQHKVGDRNKRDKQKLEVTVKPNEHNTVEVEFK